MLLQEKLISVIKEKCENDPRISACMMYGSFTKGEGDKYSNVEFYVYLKEALYHAYLNALHVVDGLVLILADYYQLT